MGSLDLIVGCMFSGKSTELIRRCERYKIIDKKVLFINSVKDTRAKTGFGVYKNFPLGHLTTHQNKSIQCIQVDNLNKLLSEEVYKDWDVFGIDEGQFFSDLKPLVDLVNIHKKIVIISGLDGDYKQNVFGNIIHLIPQCDSITKLHALCKICNDGTKGIFSRRMICEQSQEMIGGKNEYIAVCRNHIDSKYSGE